MATETSVDLRLDSLSWNCLHVVFGGLFLKLEREPDEQSQHERLKDLRKNVRKILEACPEISELTDLLDEQVGSISYSKHIRWVSGKPETVSITFPPLIGILQLPLRLQKWPKIIPGAEIERFVVVLDGTTLLIGALCSQEQYVSGFPDARDKLEQMIEKACKFESVAPNVTRKALYVVNGSKNTPATERRNEVLTLRAPVALKEAIGDVYMRFDLDLGLLYAASQLSDKVARTTSSIAGEEGGLLDLVRGFLVTGFWNILKRRSTSKEIRLKIATLLGLLSLHSSLMEELARNEVEIEGRFQDDELVRTTMERNSWKDYVQSGTVDRSSVMAVIEHARSEMQSYGIAFVTLWAAIIGAIMGSIVTLLATSVGKLFGG